MSGTYTIGFILEQTLGHRTHSQNLQSNVPGDPSVRALWGPVEWEARGLAAKLPIYNSNWTVRAGLQARRLIADMQRSTPLDALFIHTQVPAILATNWVKRLPSVVSLDATPIQYDSLGAFYEHETGAGWMEQQKWRLNRNCFRHANKLVTWTHWTKQGLVDAYEVPAEKVTVIPPGVNPLEWAHPTGRKNDNSVVRILFVGGDLKRKGGDLLLEAFRALRQQMASRRQENSSTLELHLVTRDTVAEEPGVFVYNNMQPNSGPLKQLFHDCHIFCLPTLGDCLPMVLSEAGAAGLPAVSTQVGGIAEIVKEGKTGFLVPTGDVSALVDALQTLVENPALRLEQGQRAVDVVRQSFDAKKNATRLLTLLKQTADEVSGRVPVVQWKTQPEI